MLHFKVFFSQARRQLLRHGCSPYFSLQNEANDTKVNVPTETPTPTAEWYVVRTEASQGHCTVLGTMGLQKQALLIILITAQDQALHSVLRCPTGQKVPWRGESDPESTKNIPALLRAV